MLDLLRNYATQKTTWAGLLTIIATVAGINLLPDQSEAIATAGVAVASAVLVFFNENK